jgi:hypothetical protein
MNTDFDEVTWVAEGLPQVGDPDGVATDRAHLALLEHISAAPRPRRWRRRLGLRLAAVASATVAVGVVAIGLGSGRPDTTGTTSVPRVALAPQPHVVSGHRVLLRLAGDLTQAPAPPGNATLVFRHHTFPDQTRFSGYDLYEDNGAYYYGDTLDELRQALSDPSTADKQLGGILAAAARSANLAPAQAATNIYRASPAPSSVTAYTTGLRMALAKLAGDKGRAAMIQSLRQRLAEISNATPSAAKRLALPSQATIDNYLWGNCMDALEGGGGRADIRAGAMLALATLPEVKITKTTFDGQRVVQITNTQFADGYAETLDLDARTGVLVHMSGGTVGKPDSVDVTYRVTRVSAPSLDPAH